MSLPLPDPMRRGRVVVVTGGAGGIGWATAQAFARAGDHVVILDRDGDAAARCAAELGPGHHAIATDMGEEAQVVAALTQVDAIHGRIDIFVNNAGIVDPLALPVLDKSLDAHRALMAINLDGAYVAAREAGRIMLRGEVGGCIVNIASLAGVVAIPYRTSYSISKAALIGFTRALACEWAGQGIRVNAVLPGYVETAIVRKLHCQHKIDLAQVNQRIPLARLCAPEEIAAAIFHLASPDASYTTGALITVDGGYQAFGGTAAASSGPPASIPPSDGGEVAIVTGGASGIGSAIVARLRAEGRRVIIFDRAPAGDDALRVDISDEGQVAEAVATVMARHGRIDMLINNAGIADSFTPTVDQQLRHFRKVVDVNLNGALVMARAVAPAMIAAGRGVIVNLASIAGIGGLPRRNAYCAAKSGVIMLTRSLACEWAQHGIRVNAVAPGYIATEGVAALEQSGLRDLGSIRRRVPLGRLGRPEEIAAVVSFLASDAASYMTGSLYCADGGWSAFTDAGDASDGV